MVFLSFYKVRQQDAAQDQQDAHAAQGRDTLPQEHRAEDGGEGGAKGAQQAGALCGGVALRHRLEGVAEAGADDGQRQDDAPLRGGMGQTQGFEDIGTDGVYAFFRAA